jgi:hypothetical protein
MDALINVVIPVFGIVLTGYLAGRLEVLGADSAAALNRFVYYFAFPAALFVFAARAPIDKTFNWPFIGAFVSGSVLTLLIALIVGRLWFGYKIATFSNRWVHRRFWERHCNGIAAPPYGLRTEWSIAAHRCRTHLHCTLHQQHYCCLGGRTNCRAIQASRGHEIGRHSFTQPGCDLPTAGHPIFGNGFIYPQGSQQLPRSDGRRCSPSGLVCCGAFACRS